MATQAELMKAYRPRRTPGSADDVVYSDTKKSMLQDVQDEKDREKIKSMGYAKGGMTASKRADGCCSRGKTRGKMV